MPKILLIDNDASVAEAFSSILEPMGHNIELEQSSERLLTSGKSSFDYDIVVADIDCGGMELLSRIKKYHPTIPVILTTSTPTKLTALQALREQAFDYLKKPVRVKEFSNAVSKGIEKSQSPNKKPDIIIAPAQTQEWDNCLPLMGKSLPVQNLRKEVLSLIEDTTNSTIILQGNRGSGRQLLAHAMHGKRYPKGKSYISINCSENDVVELLSESTTGKDSRSLFKTPDLGTIYVEDIDSLSPELQATVLKERKAFAPDCLLLLGMTQNAEDAMTEGTLSIELYYAAAMSILLLPTMEERIPDLSTLIAQIIENSPSISDNYRNTQFDTNAMAWLQARQWDEGLLEFQHTILLGVLESEGKTVTEQLLRRICR